MLRELVISIAFLFATVGIIFSFVVMEKSVHKLNNQTVSIIREANEVK